MNAAMRRRAHSVLAGILTVLGIGLAYYVFYRATGLGIPCPIRLVTGRLCPGCGMTRAMAALLQGNLSEACRQNRLVPIVIPVLIVYGGIKAVQYVRRGESDYAVWEIVLLTMLAVAAIAYGIIRNLGRVPDPTILERIGRLFAG